jgi:hypothetical protein
VHCSKKTPYSITASAMASSVVRYGTLTFGYLPPAEFLKPFAEPVRLNALRITSSKAGRVQWLPVAMRDGRLCRRHPGGELPAPIMAHSSGTFSIVVCLPASVRSVCAEERRTMYWSC